MFPSVFKVIFTERDYVIWFLLKRETMVSNIYFFLSKRYYFTRYFIRIQFNSIVIQFQLTSVLAS
jgi:uncharacterized membrane protein